MSFRYMQLWQSALCGMILKLDHSFKVVKRVRYATAHKPFSAVLTAMNEFCQVRYGRGLSQFGSNYTLWQAAASSTPPRWQPLPLTLHPPHVCRCWRAFQQRASHWRSCSLS